MSFNSTSYVICWEIKIRCSQIVLVYVLVKFLFLISSLYVAIAVSSSDIDECSGGEPNNCTGVAMCVNEPGMYSCGCPSGYVLNNDSISCSGGYILSISPFLSPSLGLSYMIDFTCCLT